jgi:CheY-like chemotaxis protein
MIERPMMLLVVDDNPGDAELLQFMLAKLAPGRMSFIQVETLAQALHELSQHSLDVVLLDLSLPDSMGLEGCLRIHAQYPDLPIVILSGLDDEQIALEAVKGGAQDYLVKGAFNAALQLRTIRNAIERSHTLTALRARDERVRLILGSLPMILFALDQEGIFTLSEGNGLSKLGLFPGQLVGQSVFAVYQDVPAILSDVRRALSGDRFVSKAEVAGVIFEVRYSPLTDLHGVLIGTTGIAIDINE